MEISDQLKQLYNHFGYHTNPRLAQTDVNLDSGLLEKVKEFASERMAVWQRKENGESAPFTQDRILRDFRFCNIYRELDRQTIIIHESLKTLRHDYHLFFLNVLFQCFICRPETFQEIGLLSFIESENKAVFDRLMKTGRPRFGSAYIFPVSIIQKSNNPTR